MELRSELATEPILHGRPGRSGYISARLQPQHDIGLSRRANLIGLRLEVPQNLLRDMETDDGKAKLHQYDVSQPSWRQLYLPVLI